MKFQSDMDYICTMNNTSEEQKTKIMDMMEKYCG